MSRVVILGAGVSGHTAAAFARKWLDRNDTVIVVSPKPDYNWIPSNIWVGVGLMQPAEVIFPLAPVYERHGIEFVQAAGGGSASRGTSRATRRRTSSSSRRERDTKAREAVRYDYPDQRDRPAAELRRDRGPGPGRQHAVRLHRNRRAARPRGARRARSSGCARASASGSSSDVGHGSCTCEGAAFEYVVNLEFELRARGVRDRAEITWITNEYELGDFGMGGMHLKRGGYVTPSSIFTASLFAERGIGWINRAHVRKVEPDRVLYETLDGDEHELGVRLRDAAAAVHRRGAEGVRPRRRGHYASGCSCPTGS